MAGLGDAPLPRSPVSAAAISRSQIDALGATRLADLIQLDSSVSDAYNTQGYWDYATVRGFVLDNQHNFRRDGLPINAETHIALDNKERVELFKGTSGMQSGTSAPGGLVNFVVKRPTAQDLRTSTVSTSSNGGLLVALDVGGRFNLTANTDVAGATASAGAGAGAGAGSTARSGAFGYRLNAVLEDIGSYANQATGSRRLLSAAVDWRVAPDTLLQAEIESSSRSQPSVPGLSLLGSKLPAPDNKINLNSQPWSQPVVLAGVTASVGIEQALGADARWSLRASSQRLVSQDRVAFPFGPNYANGFVSYGLNGDYDLYDFRSEDERRQLDALQANWRNKMQIGSVTHELVLGALRSRATTRAHPQAYNYVGTGNIAAIVPLPADPTTADFSGNRDESSTELSAVDAITWSPQWSTWLGLRSTHLSRKSAYTLGGELSNYEQTFNAPFFALGFKPKVAVLANTLVYASRGFGIESVAAPNLPIYSNAGQVLPALQSAQTEIGIKSTAQEFQWSAAWFDIRRPRFADSGACDGALASCTRQVDGQDHHSGLELQGHWQSGAWQLSSGATWLRATQEASTITPEGGGKRPINVPAVIVRVQASYDVSTVPGLTINASLSHEGNRSVLPDESLSLPGWTRFDLGTRYISTFSGLKTTWHVSADNLFDRKYFRESPLQFGHVYLFSGAPRTLRLSAQTSF